MEGGYGFKLDSNGPSTLSIDGERLIDNPGIAEGSSAAHESRRSRTWLASGPHRIEVTLQHRYGSPQVFLHWTPPGQSPGPIPWSSFRPAPPGPLP